MCFSSEHPVAYVKFWPSGSTPIWRADLHMDWQRNEESIEDLERQLKHIKWTDSLGSVGFNDLYIHLGWNLLNSNVLNSRNMMEKLSIRSFKVYNVAMAQYRDNDKLLVQTFPQSLTWAVLAWFIKLEISKIKRWSDLAHLFVEQYKFSSEISPNREQLQWMSKISSESFRDYAKKWLQTDS